MTEHNQPLVLLVDSSDAGTPLLSEELLSRFQVETVSSIAAASQVLESSVINLLVTDHPLPDGTGLDMLGKALGYWPPIPVVFMIAEGDEKTAVTALQKGAADYITKGSTTALRLQQVLSNALARTQAEVLAQQRAREMGVLNVILTALNRELAERPVLDTIVQEVHALMSTDACSIFLLDESGQYLTFRASTRLPVDEETYRVPVDKSIAGRILRQKQGEITADVTKDPDWQHLDVDHLVPTPVKSMLTVPLVSGNEAIGVLQAINKSVDPFLPSDLALMNSIAAVATAAITRGRQYAELQEALKKAAG